MKVPSKMERFYIVVWIATLTAVCSGQIILGPVNTAVAAGEEVRLNCSANIPEFDFLEWRHYLDPDIPSGTRIWISIYGVSLDPRFEVEVDGDNYDLIILKAGQEEAGAYVCRTVLEEDIAAVNIVVLGDLGCRPYIEPPPMPPNVVEVTEGEIMQFWCEVEFVGYKAPVLEWWNKHGVIAGEYGIDEAANIAFATANVTATVDLDAEHFECHLFFDRKPEDDSEPPTHTDMCFSYYYVKPVCSGQIILGPVNTAVAAGEEVRLNCSANIPEFDFLEWRHYLDPDKPSGTRIWLSSDGVSLDPRFEVKVDGDNYDLIILKAGQKEAGAYVCRLVLEEDNAAVNVVVLGDLGCRPYIAPPPMPPNVVEVTEGEIMQFWCEVEFVGYKAPVLEWWNKHGVVAGEYGIDEAANIAFATANVTATADLDAEHFECHLFFDRKLEDDSEPPTLTDMCFSYYYVKHAPTEIEIYPNPDAVEGGILSLNVGDWVNCTASGRPEPTYAWYEQISGEFIEGNTLEITQDMADKEEEEYPLIWTCRAYNIINGQPRESEKEVKMWILSQTVQM